LSTSTAQAELSFLTIHVFQPVPEPFRLRAGKAKHYGDENWRNPKTFAGCAMSAL
jgi:hypothetical protein